MVIKIFVLLFLSILFLSVASALVGVTPAKTQIDFVPFYKQVFHFEFFGDDLPLKLSLEGDLAQYAKLSTLQLDGPGGVNVLLTLPANIEIPGNHRLLVGAEQYSGAGVGIGIVGGMRAAIDVKVPYPGQYASVELSTSSVNAGELVPVTYKIYNLGKETLTTQSTLEIFNAQEVKMDTFSLGESVIEPTHMEDLSRNLNLTHYAPGFYTAKASVAYGERTAVADSKFRLGELFVNLTNYTSFFIPGKINRIDLDIESFWNDPLDNVYANITVLNHTLDFLTPSITLSGFQKTTLTGYFDTSSITEDPFFALVNVHYGDKTTEQLLTLHFKKSTVPYTLLGSILLFALLVLSWWWRRRQYVSR